MPRLHRCKLTFEFGSGLQDRAGQVERVVSKDEPTGEMGEGETDTSRCSDEKRKAMNQAQINRCCCRLELVS